VEAERAQNGSDSLAAFLTLESEDSDGDGFSNIEEITNSVLDPGSPTFPGFSAGNVGQVSNVDTADIDDYLIPSTGEDLDPPTVSVISPTGGTVAIGNAPTLIEWTADDGAGSGLVSIELYLSLDGGSSYKHISQFLPGTTTNFTWFVSNRPSSNAVVRVEAYDNAGNEGHADSAEFIIISTNAFVTTLRDFDQPGTQPIEESGLAQLLPDGCADCHGNYSDEHEPYMNWLGSMMAHASYDPLFKANLAIAQQDAPDSGDLCLRCHNSRGWLDGRSSPTDGSQMTPEDMFGVSCDLCHRMVDPVYKPGISPVEDDAILTALADVPEDSCNGNGMYVFDPQSNRRGPYDDTISDHADLYSPFHKEAAICGTCHNVSNPVFERDGTNAEYVANDWDAPATNFSPEILMPVERTYSEWLHSAYNSSNGVYAPQFAGNKSDGMVSTCQDCHMPDILGHGADTNLYPVALREDLPLHDMAGGSSWLIRIMPTLSNFPYSVGSPEAVAMSNGAHRAEYMLHKAARLYAEDVGGQLQVRVVNDTGHKLPSGYPEGRRMWINVQFFDAGDQLIEELGGYNYSNAVLTTTNTTVYEVHPGIGTNLAAALSMDPGPSLHFVLNNQIYEDNRIPPRGFTNSVFETFGGAPVGHHYDDGQYWDEVLYEMPVDAVRAHVRLYYQSTSKEFVEFLRDENHTTSDGQYFYDLWAANDRCPPVLMTEAFWPENFELHSPVWLAGSKLGLPFNSISGYTYWIEHADALGSNVVWQPFLSNGMLEAIGSGSAFTDDFTTATSGGGLTNAQRFYRIRR
jgi:hypothetical protein